MSLSNLIRRKSEPVGFATATPATFATKEGQRGRTVATVAVAKFPQGQTAPPTIRQASAPLTANEESAIRAWLALIEETDRATIAEAIGQCQRDADARDYFTGRAAVEMPKPDPFPDDRRTCGECLNLRGRVCSVAIPGGLVSANRGYQPMRDVLQRCAGYLPNTTDQDQRPGKERWPGLIDTRDKRGNGT